jgi:hypothetical protein
VLDTSSMDTISYLKLSCDQVISSCCKRVNYNTTHIVQLSRYVETNVSVLIAVVPFTPSFKAIGKQVSVRVGWYIVVADWNLRTRIRMNALFVSP